MLQAATRRIYGRALTCSLITISVVSARGRLTRDATVVESVSRMILNVGRLSAVQHVDLER